MTGASKNERQPTETQRVGAATQETAHFANYANAILSHSDMTTRAPGPGDVPGHSI
jgi:hypothetical protein